MTEHQAVLAECNFAHPGKRAHISNTYFQEDSGLHMVIVLTKLNQTNVK